MLKVILTLNTKINVTGFYNPNVGSGSYYACPTGLASHFPGSSACIGRSFIVKSIVVLMLM